VQETGPAQLFANAHCHQHAWLFLANIRATTILSIIVLRPTAVSRDIGSIINRRRYRLTGFWRRATSSLPRQNRMLPGNKPSRCGKKSRPHLKFCIVSANAFQPAPLSEPTPCIVCSSGRVAAVPPSLFSVPCFKHRFRNRVVPEILFNYILAFGSGPTARADRSSESLPEAPQFV